MIRMREAYAMLLPIWYCENLTPIHDYSRNIYDSSKIYQAILLRLAELVQVGISMRVIDD